MRAIFAVKGALALCLLSLFALSCGDRAIDLEREQPIPRLPVALRLSLNHEGRLLREPYSFIAFTQPRYQGEYLGHLGVVVVHGMGGSYSAYELACTHCWPVRSRTIASIDNPKGLVVAECPVCQSVYDLALGFGSPIAGPAKYPLLDYRVATNGDILLIH